VPEGILWDLLDTPVSEPWPLLSHVEFANIISGMAPHDIVYTTHVIIAMLSKARACYLSRQQYYEGLKFYVEIAEDGDKKVQQLTVTAQEDKAKHQLEKDKLTATADHLSADLFQAMQDAKDKALEMESVRAACVRTQRLRDSEDRVTYQQAALETRVGERMAEVEEALEDKTAELDEISEALIKSREQFADLLSATKRKHWLRRTREYVCNTPHSQKN